MDTPVPIPNTEVKHFSGDNSCACRSEDNTLPGRTHYRGSFFFFSCFPISSDGREGTVTEAKMKDAERKKVRIGQETIERSSEKEKREDEKKR